MSDAVALALIAMFQSWGDAFASNLHLTLPAAGTALIAWMTWRNNQKSEARAEILKTKVAEVEAAAITTAAQAELMVKGAERRGVEIGMKTERLRTSDLQALRDDYKPESTDVFMSRTDPHDKP